LLESQQADAALLLDYQQRRPIRRCFKFNSAVAGRARRCAHSGNIDGEIGLMLTQFVVYK
jgi:hypothetical protein